MDVLAPALEEKKAANTSLSRQMARRDLRRTKALERERSDTPPALRNIDDGSKLDSRAPKAKEVAHAIETLPFDARRGVASRIDADSVCTGPG
jgi:hypothetical protein